MINLLPTKEKDFLRQEESFRLVAVLGIVIFLSLLSFTLMLFSLKFYIIGELDSQSIFIQQKESEISIYTDLEKEIEIQNLCFSNLKSFYSNAISRTYILEKISGNIPNKMFLESLTLRSSENEKNQERESFQVFLTGFSPDRAMLESFKSNLESEISFENVYFPPSNWIVGENNINFSVNFEINIDEL
ncbi:MAG: PilN domain-containing protein [Patescibacteria group bacterium]